LEVLPEGLPFDEEDDDEIVKREGEGMNGVGEGGKINSGAGSGSGKGKRMSKVDVLTRAARVIRFLEGDVEVVRREVEVLRREREAVLGGVHLGGGSNGG
jgi:hypothetical protein